MSQRKYAAQVLNVLEARGAGRSAWQLDLDVHAVRHLDPHELPQRAFVCVEVDEPLVDPHLPAVPCLAPLPVGGLPHRHDEPFRRERNRARHRDAGALADQLDLLAHVVDLLRVGAAERDAGLLGHGASWRGETEGQGVRAARRCGRAWVARGRSFSSHPRTLEPTLSPGSAWGISSSCISIDLTSPMLSDGMKWIFIPTFRSPVSTRPTGTVPAPVIE